MKEGITRTSSNAHVFKAAIGACLLALAVFIIIPMSQRISGQIEKQVVYREVRPIKIPPPEVDQEPEQDESNNTLLSSDIEITEPVQQIALEPLDAALNAGMGANLNVGLQSFSYTVDASINIAQNIKDIFNFSELSQPPGLINARQIRMKFPFERSFTRSRGIKKIELEIQVLIDETGIAKLEDITKRSMHHDAIDREVRNVVRQMRFSRTEVEGRPVKVRGTMPLTFQSPW